MHKSILAPAQYDWLNATFDRNRRLYGGLSMEGNGTGGEGDESEPGDQQAGGKGSDKPGDKGDDAPLGEAGKRALEAEREERKKLKSELDSFKTALAEALGINAGDKGDEQKDLLTSVQQQVKDMQREAAVLRLANAHKITDEADLKLLASTEDDATREALAKRLAPGENNGSGTPKPDPTQGGAGGAGDGSGSRTGSVQSAREDYLERRKKKTA